MQKTSFWSQQPMERTRMRRYKRKLKKVICSKSQFILDGIGLLITIQNLIKYIYFTTNMKRQEDQTSNITIPTIERLSSSAKQEIQRSLEPSRKNSAAQNLGSLIGAAQKELADRKLRQVCEGQDESFVFEDSDQSMVTRATEDISALPSLESQRLNMEIQSRKSSKGPSGSESRQNFLKQKINLADLQKVIPKNK